MKRSLTIIAIFAVGASTVVITGLAQNAKGTKAVEIKKLATFESEFNKHINEVIRGEVQNKGEIWETKCYKDFYDKKLWRASTRAASSCVLDRAQLQEVRDLVNRHLDEMYSKEGDLKELSEFTSLGKIGADFHTEKLYKP